MGGLLVGKYDHTILRDQLVRRCRRAKAVFAELQVPYVWIDIDQNPQAAAFVKHVNRGLRRVPTLVFPDGSILVEPDSDTLTRKTVPNSSPSPPNLMTACAV